MRRTLLTIICLLTGSNLMPLMADSAFDKQVRELNLKISQARHQHDDKELGKQITARMATYYNAGETDSVNAYFEEDMNNLRHIRQWNNYYEVWTFYINTLIYYSNSKNQALREVQQMFADAMDRQEIYGQGIAYYTMGNVYLNMNNLEESANAYDKGLKLLLTLSPLPIYTAEVFSYLGDVLNEQGKYQQLQELTVEWEKFIQRYIAEDSSLDAAHQNLLWFYYDIACAQAAIGQQRLDEAEKILTHANDIKGKEVSYENMAWLVTQSQLRLKQGRYAEAFELNTRRMNLLMEGEDKAIFLTVASQRAEILSRLHRYEESSALYHEMYRLKDSISSADTKNQLNELNTMFHVDELKMEQERTQFRNTLIIAGIILLAMIVFIVFRTIAARRLKKAHDQLQATHEELLTAYDQLEETTTAKERIESDLRIARSIQMSMVPNTFPDYEGLDMYASMTPAKEVGGDLYGYVLLDNKLYFALGDVSGKGVPASLFMAQATRLFRTLAAQQMMPAQICYMMNEALSGEDNESSMFVTFFLGLVDLTTGHLDFCNAGHNPPVISHGESNGEFLEMIPNAPIGLFPGLDYEGEEIDDIRGCQLFIYTDGLNEAENRQQEQFGDDQLLNILRTTHFESARQVIESLTTLVEQHRDGAEPNDDLTMLCVRIINKSDNQ